MYVYQVDLVHEDNGGLYGINTEYLMNEQKYSEKEFKDICNEVFTYDDCVFCNIEDKLKEYGFEALKPNGIFLKSNYSEE